MKWYHCLFRPLRNWIGALNGLSGCQLCGDKWNWKKPHIVQLTSFESAFPVCDECWKTAKTEDIVRAARNLGDMWICSPSLCAEQLRKTRRKASLMVKAVEKAAKKRCDFCPVGPMRKYMMPVACVGCVSKQIEKDGFKEQIRKRAEKSKGLREASS